MMNTWASIWAWRSWGERRWTRSGGSGREPVEARVEQVLFVRCPRCGRNSRWCVDHSYWYSGVCWLLARFRCCHFRSSLLLLLQLSFSLFAFAFTLFSFAFAFSLPIIITHLKKLTLKMTIIKVIITYYNSHQNFWKTRKPTLTSLVVVGNQLLEVDFRKDFRFIKRI